MNTSVQSLRSFIDSKKRAIRDAEREYDVVLAGHLLSELAQPLTHPQGFHESWKQLYLDHFYRETVRYLVSFVGVHVLPGLSETQRSAAFDVFFDTAHVPAMSSVTALMTQLSSVNASQLNQPTSVNQESLQALTLCVRLLQRVLEDRGFARITQDLFDAYSDVAARGRALAISQPTISSLCSIADLVHNRLQRSTPAFFAPRQYFAQLCQQLLDVLITGRVPTTRTTQATVNDARASVFRLFADKMARIGHLDDLVRAWLARSDIYSPDHQAAHEHLLASLPPAANEPFLLFFTNLPRTSLGDTSVSAPQYRLLSLVPEELTTSKQFQHVVVHKIILAKSIHDPVIARLLVDALAKHRVVAPESTLPIVQVFDVVVSRWSGQDFPTSTDYNLNASMSFFLRYAMAKVPRDECAQHDWTARVCRGVQAHMSHSVERVRLLGMRVGESVSKIMSPEQPLNFEINEPDVLEEVTAMQFDFAQATVNTEEESRTALGGGSTTVGASEALAKVKSHQSRGLKSIDPDAVVDSDEDEASENEGDDGRDDDDDSDSDISLDAYDLQDDEQDLATPRPLYIKELVARLLADDDREKTEAALAECEALLRRQPKDLQFTAKDVVTALLRLEDKYNTPNFVLLRSKALAAACALAPAGAVPYLQAQALEHEQLLQSRLDVLHALTTAAQELSGTGAFRPDTPKSLLLEDMETRTTNGLKTRRFGYRRDPLMPAKKNAFGDHALSFFTPLLFGFVEYTRKMEASRRMREIDDVFLAHLLHTLASFVECAGHAPPAIPMAKCLMEFAWHHRSSGTAAVRRQVLYAFSRVLFTVPPFLLRQELGQNVIEMVAWLQETHHQDPDEGCRDGSRLLLSSGAVPMLSM